MSKEASAEGFFGLRVTMSDGATETLNQFMELTIGEKLVIMLKGLDQASTAEITSTHPRVRLFWWHLLSVIKSLAKAEQYRQRPVFPLPAKQKVAIPGIPPGRKLCPDCENDLDTVVLCFTCDGAGTVPIEDPE